MTNLIGILNLKAKWPPKKKSLETKMIIYVNLKDVRIKKFTQQTKVITFGIPIFTFIVDWF